MDHRHLDPRDEGRLTLRVSVGWLAFFAALALHAIVVVVASLLPEPPKPQERIELTLAPPPTAMSPAPQAAAPKAAPAPQREPKPKKEPRSSPRPSTSPVAPELPPSVEPPENRAQLPVVETSPEPAPPPEPSTWEDRLREQLAATTPKRPRSPTGALAPSTAGLHSVAGNDPRLHDEATERRLMEDFGPFFRRGLEALRGHWHPDEVLNENERDPTKRCGRQTRTTYAVAVIDKQGYVVDVDLRKPSGCPGLDEEAIAAFKRVAHFPFPPAGIFVAPDGTPRETARYPVRFIVTFDGGLRLDWR